MQLHEQYRPTKFSEVVCQKRVLARIERIRKRGLGGRAYWISGLSGTGKTTIAKLLAGEIASEWCIDEADACELTASRVRELERQSYARGWDGGSGKTGRAYIVNEAHGMNKRVVKQFLTTLDTDRVPSHVVWIFTTTCAGQKLLFDDSVDASPLVSRCIKLELADKGLSVGFARRARKIAQAEGMDSQPLTDYVQLCRKHDHNLRAVLQEIEAGAFDE